MASDHLYRCINQSADFKYRTRYGRVFETTSVGDWLAAHPYNQPGANLPDANVAFSLALKESRLLFLVANVPKSAVETAL